MTMEILEIARREYNEAKEFYEADQRGLSSQFEKQIRHSLLRIQRYPQAWPPERKEIRRYIVHKFPYKILYSIQDDKIVVLVRVRDVVVEIAWRTVRGWTPTMYPIKCADEIRSVEWREGTP